MIFYICLQGLQTYSLWLAKDPNFKLNIPGYDRVHEIAKKAFSIRKPLGPIELEV